MDNATTAAPEVASSQSATQPAGAAAGMVFCRGCGKEIHNSAVACPHCGAPQKSAPAVMNTSGPFTSYEQVPWFRKNWFAIVCFLIFTPGLLFILGTGDVYYEKKGELKTYSKTAKIVLMVLASLALVRVLVTLVKG